MATTHASAPPAQERQCQHYFDGQAPVLLLISIIENTIILLCLPSLRTSRSSYTHRIVLLMSANDLFGCLMLFTSSMWDAAVCTGIGHTTQCNVLGLLGFSSFCWSVLIVVVISIDRTIMVHWPLWHHSHCTFRHLVVGSLGGLCIFVGIFVVPLLGIGKPYMYFKKNGFCAFNLSTAGGISHKVLVGVVSALLCGAVILIITCNVAMMLKLRKSTKKMESLTATYESGGTTAASKGLMGNNCTISRSNNHLTSLANTALTPPPAPPRPSTRAQHTRAFQKLTLAIAIINTVLNLPFAVRITVDVFREKDDLDNLEDHITAGLMFIGPVVNPIVYVAVNRLYRQHIKACVLRVCGCVCPTAWRAKMATTTVEITLSETEGKEQVSTK